MAEGKSLENPEKSQQPHSKKIHLTSVAAPCCLQGNRTGAPFAAQDPTDAPAGTQPPAPPSPAVSYPQEQLLRERRLRASDLGAAKRKVTFGLTGAKHHPHFLNSLFFHISFIFISSSYFYMLYQSLASAKPGRRVAFGYNWGTS